MLYYKELIDFDVVPDSYWLFYSFVFFDVASSTFFLHKNPFIKLYLTRALINDF